MKDKEKTKASNSNEYGSKKTKTQKENNPVSCWICTKEHYAKNFPLIQQKVNALE